MIFIEMSRDMEHGGPGWEFPTCVWSPTKKEKGGRWPFWELVNAARPGDVVIHLRGTGASATFVGYSTVATAGHVTSERPPSPSAWSWSGEFYRADLTDFVPLAEPVLLSTVFANRRTELEGYFKANKARPNESRRHIFMVMQRGRLQCLNGAYFSEVDEALHVALFGDLIARASERRQQSTVAVGTQLRQVLARIGQREFSDNVRDAYGGRCCFPGCEVDDRRFLIGSHIARWADNEQLRGELANGLCLCLIHDKAFEVGLFWLEDDLAITINGGVPLPNGPLGQELHAAQGRRIRQGDIVPLAEAIREHRGRFAQPQDR